MSSSNPDNRLPALLPPPGVTSNFADPYSLSPAFVVTAVLCLLFATFAVVVRLAIAFGGPTGRIRVEDYFCILAWLGLIITCIFSALQVQGGFGRHQWDVPLSSLDYLMKLFYVSRLFYSPTILIAKLTVLFQIMRIFVPVKEGLVYWLNTGLIWLNTGFYFANFVSIVFMCSPMRKEWDTSAPGTCIDADMNLIITGVINIVSDALILLLPLWTIWHLKMPTQRKLGVSITFAAGIFANFAGIMRFYYSILILHSEDLTYLRLQHGMWKIAEITTVIFCASLPLVPQFIKLFRPKYLTLISSASSAPAAHLAARSAAYGAAEAV